jgi:hypothetical protein
MRNNFRQKFCFEGLKFIECIMAPLKKTRIDPPVPTTPFEMWPGAQGFSIYERNSRKRLTLTGGHEEQYQYVIYHLEMLLSAINTSRYFEVRTINRINRLKLVNCSTKFTAVLSLLDLQLYSTKFTVVLLYP